jgi:hypothetical protein
MRPCPLRSRSIAEARTFVLVAPCSTLVSFVRLTAGCALCVVDLHGGLSEGQHKKGDTHVEEVRVQRGLDEARHDGDGIDRVLGKVPIDPVGDVQRPVRAQRKEVVGRDGLCLARPLQHEELREDRDGFEVDAEGPEDFNELAVAHVSRTCEPSGATHKR